MAMVDADDVAPALQYMRLIRNGSSSSSSRRNSLKKDCKQSPFASLPDEIVTQILSLADPSSFASLVVLNRQWRRTAQQAALYALQLSRCPSYAASHRDLSLNPPETELPSLRRQFVTEVRRNLFEAYLRPRITTIKLVSTTTSSSAAFPGGEAFHFVFSPLGGLILAYSSSRLYVLDVVSPELKVKRAFKLPRRPISTAITDDVSLLAILNTTHRVDLYNLKSTPAQHVSAIEFDNPTRTIALSPGGCVLAAAHDGGIEVLCLQAEAGVNRRSVKCETVDRLSFSSDGAQLLGTTQNPSNPSTVILTAPYYDAGAVMARENISQLWTTSILFPNSTRDCSHSSLLSSSDSSDASWIFAYDRVFETYRAVRTDDLRNGTTYFTGPLPNASSPKLLPNTLAAPNQSGEVVAAGFKGKEIWLYGVPEDLDALPDSAQSHSDASGMTAPGHALRRNSAPSLSSMDATTVRIPQWQLLLDKFRNTFVRGRNVANFEGVTALKWVSNKSFGVERLIGVAPGVAKLSSAFDEEAFDPVDGGRISFFDFRYDIVNGDHLSITVEVGEEDAEELQETTRDLDTEVALARKRTVAQQRRANRQSQLNLPRRQPPKSEKQPKIPPIPPDTKIMPPPSQAEQLDNVSMDGEEGFDDPYSQGAPRSVVTLRRAATAAALSRRPHNPAVVNNQPRMRPADGRGEVPHESDADNWVPPPPPYSKDPIDELPSFLRSPVISSPPILPSPGLSRSSSQRSWTRDEPVRSPLHRSHTIASSTSSEGINSRVRFRRDSAATFKSSTTTDEVRGHLSLGLEAHPETKESPVPSPQVSPETSPNLPAVRDNANEESSRRFSFDDLYDVSPPDSPVQQATRPNDTSPTRPTPLQLDRGRADEPGPPSPTESIPAPVMESSLKQPAPAMPEAMARYMYKKNLETPPEGTSSTGQQRPPPRPFPDYFGSASAGSFSVQPPRQSPRSNTAFASPPRGTPRRRISNSMEYTSSAASTISSLSDASSLRNYTVSPISRSSTQISGRSTWQQQRRSGSLPQVLQIGRPFNDSRSDLPQDQSPVPGLPPAAGTWPLTAPRSPPATVDAPSTEQLAKLNNRNVRPVSFDPARARALASVPARVPVGSRPFMPNSSSAPSMPPVPVPPIPQHYGGPPPGAIGVHVQPTLPQMTYREAQDSRVGYSNGQFALSTPNLRPPMNRLETIQSHSSANDANPRMLREINANMPLEAPFSASLKPSKSTRRRGWSGTVRRKKKAEGSVISAVTRRTAKSAKTARTEPWTRVEYATHGDPRQTEWEQRKNADKKGGKCVIM